MSCLISVIIPVFNAEPYLKYAIDSVINQSLQDFEVIIINDGSSDRSEEIIMSYNNPVIKYINHEKNRGLVYSLNEGIRESLGEYIVRMDHDDICLPERLEVQLRFLENNKDYGLCSSDISTINEKGELLQSNFYGRLNLPLEWEILWQNPIAHPSVMIRKSFILNNNLSYKETNYPADDYGLWCDCILKAPIIRLSETLLKYRILNNSAFHSSKAKALEKASLITTEYAKKLTGLNPPIFHSYFYYQGADRSSMISIVSIKDASEWLKTLKLSLQKKYNWTLKQKRSVDYDINTKLLKMLYHKDLRFLQKIFSARYLSIYLSIKYFYNTKVGHIK